MGRFLSYILLLLVLAGVGFYFYQRNITPIAVTVSDLEKGGSFSADERAAMKTACMARIKKDGDKTCGCIADKSATEVSRFDRQIITATFQEKLSDVVALSKGLVASGIPVDKVKAAEEGNKARVKEIMKSCSAE